MRRSPDGTAIGESVGSGGAGAGLGAGGGGDTYVSHSERPKIHAANAVAMMAISRNTSL